jgi:hypothetical protein
MTARAIAVALAGLFAAFTAAAQTAQPYADAAGRAIKALSAEAIADLRAGRGMGLALAAELNGFPGPLHVLELADDLKLSEAQRAAVQAQFVAMKAEAIAAGEAVIAAEAALDRQFAARGATAESLAAATAEAGLAQARLRAVHLRYHLLTTEVLNPEQIARYQVRRGYAEAGGAAAGGGAAHPPAQHHDRHRRH